ncbi:ribonuclease H-like domain-containing protein [Tanacetum coccineum]
MVSVGIKRLHDDLGVNTAKVRVTAANHNLKEEIYLETAQTTTTAKLPILKQENGNSFKPVAQTITNADGTSTSLIPGPYKDSKTLFSTIQTIFGCNEATKKTQKPLLKQMYKNFSALSTKSLDSIFNRLKKIVSQLAILGENISQEVSFAKHEDKKVFQKTSRKIIINKSDTAGYDKSKVECFNCHKMGHFTRECRGHRNQDSRNRNQDGSRRTVNVEETSSKAIMAIDGAGFD